MKWSHSFVFLLVTLLVSAGGTALASDYQEDTRELAEELTEHADPDLQAAALVTLGYMGTSEQQGMLDDFRTASGPEERLGAGAGLILAGNGDGTSFTAEQVVESSDPYATLLELAGYLSEDQLLGVVDAALAESPEGERGDILEFLATRRGALHQRLTDRLTDGDADVRRKALEVVMETAGASTLDVAEQLSNERNADIRRQMLELTEAVGAFPELQSATIELLEGTLSDGDEEIQRRAARQLVRFGSEEGSDYFVDRLDTMEPDERVEALELLLAHDAQGDIEVIRPIIQQVEMADDDDRTHEWQLLYEFAATDADGDLFDELREMFSSTHFDERIASVRSMGRTGRSEVIDLYTDGLGEGRSDIRLYSARGLGHLADPGTLRNLQSALQTESDQDVKLELVNAIGQIRDSQAANVLRFMVTDNDSEVRRAIVEALGEIGLPETTSALEMLIRDRDPEISWKAFLTLLSIDPDRASSHIRSALRNPPDNFAEFIDPHQYTDDARRALYEEMLTHATGRVHSVGLKDTMAHRDLLYADVRDLVVSDDIDESVRSELVNLIISEDDTDEAMSRLEDVVRDFAEQPAGRRAAWFMARHGSSEFEDVFDGVVSAFEIGDDETVIYVISNFALANMSE